MRRAWADGRRLRKDQGGYNWMYNTVQWRRRRLHQLRKYPLCAACLQDNHVKAATVVHHLEDHKGNWSVFISSPVESLCKQCHDNIWSDSEVLGYQRGCDINGRPYKTKPIYINKNKSRAV
jgi:5-methylcytosine-specific restriction enzyme A